MIISDNSQESSRKIKGNSVASRVKSVRMLKKFIERVLSHKEDIGPEMEIGIQGLNLIRSALLLKY